MNLKNMLEELMLNDLNGEASDLPMPLNPGECTAYLASAVSGDFATPEAVLDWLLRTIDWAEQAHYRPTAPALTAALANDAQYLSGASYAVSVPTLTALGLVPVVSDVELPLEVVSDARDRPEGESGRVLRPGPGLTVYWVENLPLPIPLGIHLRAMLDSGMRGAQETALRVLTNGTVELDDIGALLSERAALQR